MSMMSRLGALFLDGIGPVDVQARHASEYPSFSEQMATIRNRYGPHTYRQASVDEALGVPAIFSAVTLIAGTMGTLTMDAYRNEILQPAADRPRLIVRPNPFSKPYTFWFLSAFYKATRGERWWWVAARDADDSPLSLFPVPPWEVTVEQNDENRLQPTIRWNDRIIPNRDMIADFWFPSHNGLRGEGPLQKAGIAVSAAVEAEQWAANFFSGSLPSIIGTTEMDLDENDLKQLDNQWLEKPPNMPRWLHSGIKMDEAPFDPEKAQLTDTRQLNVGNVARLFNMPGSLLEHQMAGSSLTYRNDEGIWADFQRRCLGPIFAEPVEQDMSDLLSRAWTAQFNFERLQRPDAKTRYETWGLGITAGFLTAEEARRKEGLDPGSSEYAPVPVAPPQAVPRLVAADRELVATRMMSEIRCRKCGRLNGEAAGPLRMTCKRCGTFIEVVA